MGEMFEVEPSPARLVVDKEGRGRVNFRVKNASDREVRMQAQVVAEKRSEASWFAIDGQAARTLARGGVGTVVVAVAVPQGTKPGDDYGLALEVADASEPGSRPERGPEVTMDVNRRDAPHGRGVLATVIGAILGGVIGFLVALGLAGYTIGDGIYQGVNSNWTIGHTMTHIVTSVFLGFVVTVVFGLLAPWVGEVLGQASPSESGTTGASGTRCRCSPSRRRSGRSARRSSLVLLFQGDPGRSRSRCRS